jgi:hypothetical protein
MSWSINIGSVAATIVKVHVTFLLLLAWIFGVEYISGGPQEALNSLLFVVLLFLCVLLHEFGHIPGDRRRTAAPPNRRAQAAVASAKFPPRPVINQSGCCAIASVPRIPPSVRPVC